jgi:hypothetical protein
MTTEM